MPDDILTISALSSLSGTYSIDINNSVLNPPMWGNNGINWGYGPATVGTINSNSPLTQPNGISTTGNIKVGGDAEFNGGVKVGGVDVVKLLSDIQDRLAILTPNPVKLEKYESLRKAYDHYKLMEKLIGDE